MRLPLPESKESLSIINLLVSFATNERLTGGKYVVCQLIKGAVICDKCHF